MDEIPRSVPPYERSQIASSFYYCLWCRSSFPQEYGVRTHLRATHDIESPQAGDEYTNGTHLRILMDRWTEWSLLAVDRFRLHVESLRGADDLALDVGAGLPDEAFPPAEKQPKLPVGDDGA